MKILVIGAHFDDEVLGMGGTIAKHAKKGDTIYVCIITDSSSSQYPGRKHMIDVKKEESKKVNKILGIKETIYFDLPDMKLDTVPHVEINTCIEKCVKKIKPDVIYTHHKSDVNKDHILVFESSLVAGRSVKKIISYEVYNTLDFQPNIYVDISQELDIKLKAMKCYKSETRQYPHPRSIDAVKIRSQQRGIESGVEAAESFVLVKEWEK